jgi:hypothetical protein
VPPGGHRGAYEGVSGTQLVMNLVGGSRPYTCLAGGLSAAVVFGGLLGENRVE